jgi:hypothetical protein
LNNHLKSGLTIFKTEEKHTQSPGLGCGRVAF